MSEISKLIEALKDISKSNLLVIVFSIILILLVYNFNSYAPHIESLVKTVYEFKTSSVPSHDIIDHEYIEPPEVIPYTSSDNIMTPTISQPKNRFIVSLDDMDITDENINIIKGYVEDTYSIVYDLTKQLPVYIALYKFIPTGDDRYFQGRLLVTDYSKLHLDLDLMLKEIGLVWIPMWVNKGTLERIMNDENFLTELIISDNRKGIFLEDDIDLRGRVNMSIMYDIGVRWLYFYPISKGDYPIGYIVWALYGKPSDEDLDHIHTKSVILSTRVYNYMLNKVDN